MKYTIEEKLLMVKEHVNDGVPIHELEKKYGLNSGAIKYFCNLYKMYGDKAFEKPHGV